MTLTAEQVQAYAQAVWDEAGGGRIMSPAEWDLVHRWMDAEIPLAIVLRAIKDTGRPSRSLLYYQRAVERAVEMWRKALA